ncbi:Toll/interleukin-1 receptor domain-containing protein, partial [Tanacetum coccineum]
LISSTWCLNELVLILEQHRKFNQIVIPIFYHVDPSDVRKQQNSFGDAMADHKQKMEAETNAEKKNEWAQKMEIWKNALTQVANLKGKEPKNMIGSNPFLRPYPHTILLSTLVRALIEKNSLNIKKAKACMLAKAQASEASSKAKVEARGSKAKLQASTKTLIVKSPVRITNCVLGLANAKTRDAIKGKTFGVKIQ